MTKSSIEHPLYNSNKGFTQIRIVSTVLPVLIGFLITVFWERIMISTQNFYFNTMELRYSSIEWISFGIWSLFAFWIWLLGFYITKEENVSRKKMMYIIRNMHYIPNLKILNRYTAQIETISNILNPYDLNTQVEENLINEQLSDIGQAINAVLSIICDITSDFSSMHGAKFTANIMGLFEIESYKKIRNSIKHELIFTGDTDIECYKKILFMLPHLYAHEDIKEDDQPNAPIALPVSDQYKNSRGVIKSLPGAPTAIFNGNMISNDTLTLKDECMDFDKDIRIDVEKYFEKNKNKLRSFASLRLNDENDAIGILNINSNKKNFLGENDEFLLTYTALLAPIVNFLEPYVKKYQFLLQYQIELLNLQQEGEKQL